MSGFSKDDPLDVAIAFEEHRQGMAYGDDPNHCGDCKREAFLRLQAACEHDGQSVEITTLCDADRQLLCQRCGDIREVSR